jgi:5-amino-6-(5-phosphoribosylamino)uracil reductase
MRVPLVTANFAVSADGKLAGFAGGSGFGGAADLRRLLELRAAADLVLVGRGTLLADNTALGLGRAEDLRRARLAAGRPEYPARGVVCRRALPPPEHPFFTAPGGERHIFAAPAVAATGLAGPARIHPLEPGQAMPEAIAAAAADAGWQHVHLEGGPGLLRPWLEGGGIDRLFMTFCPLLVGGFGAPTLAGPGHAPPFAASLAWRLVDCSESDGRMFAVFEPARQGI